MTKWTQADFEEMRRDWIDGNLAGWKIFYWDGTTVTSRDCKFEDAPQRGVEVIIKYWKRAKGGYSREIQNGLDLYVLHPFEALDIDVPPKVKVGLNLPPERFAEILAAARADKEFVVEML